jgi:hypothetical protein
MFKQRRMMYVEYVTSMGQKRYGYRVLVGKPARGRQLGRLRLRGKEGSAYWNLVI